MCRKKNIYILQIIMLLLLYSCNSNHFRFDDNNQEIISTDTYFSEIEIENISTGECFTIRRKKNGEKEREIVLTQIGNNYTIKKCFTEQKINDIKYTNNSIYKITNVGVRDASQYAIILKCDSMGLLHVYESMQ